MSDKDKIDARLALAIEALEEARRRLRKGQNYSAYMAVKAARDGIYSIQSQLAHSSVKAAMDWGCAVRMPDGSVKITEW